ncbi:helix-turn-helix transcriptional regulator [Novosphingobium humi]|uniref:WYL domain-containing protein n=1 Tax=Novosphingobium humi TaxID=2282397 RepID=A0ABY7U5U6_9SPHN|nr:WYL domain-containing protein [Novosphingobium humi]WCT80262.1 WYL domain-containing protein [Novosphingobium humi]
MVQRLSNLDRTLKLVSHLTQSIEGLTLDDMAALLEVNRRTVERMRNVILIHFDLEEIVDGRTKRFRIKDSPGRAYTRPNAREVAALQTVVGAGQAQKTAGAPVLDALLGKIKAGFDRAERVRIDNDLELLTRLQRSRVMAGPVVIASPQDLTTIQSAILTGHCVEFDYLADGADAPSWRRVVPYGLIHGPITYLLGKRPDRDDTPYNFRLDRMQEVRESEVMACPPDDWDLDAWLAESFGIWREEGHDIVLRVRAHAVERAKGWRFHPRQSFTPDGEELLVRFHSGGLFELANHLFLWAGDLVIEGPEPLRAMMAQRLQAAQSLL